MPEVQYVQEQLGAAVLQTNKLSLTGMHERLFSRLFQNLVYAQIWEDPVADMAALEITSDDHLVCIASGGCNVMSYLTAAPASITAVDLSPAHVALLKLKLAAARHLPDHAHFYRLFGRANLPSNPGIYDRFLRDRLDPQTRTYWGGRPYGRRRIRMFAQGFYRFGLLGRFIGSAHLASRIGQVKYDALLAAETLEDQQRFFDMHMEPLFEKPIVKFLGRRPAALFGLGIPPAQFDKLAADGEGDVIPVLRERLRKLMCDFPMDDNYFAWQAFNRGYGPDGRGGVPPYLEERHFKALGTCADRVRVLNRSLTDMLSEEPASSKTAYVLLDAQDWMNDNQLNALWGQITRTAARGAKVIYRTGGSEDILPGRVRSGILSRWAYDEETSRACFEADRSAIYGGFHLYRFGG
jgi:S-adenosylmethionine-diacylglycerol 3-amino-3-carboxypropyl transferase